MDNAQPKPKPKIVYNMLQVGYLAIADAQTWPDGADTLRLFKYLLIGRESK